MGPTILRIPLTAVLAGNTLLASAQPSVDITLAPISAGQVEVRLRPDGMFNEFFAASVFTIRWPDQAELGLGTFNQPNGTAIYHAVARSGPEHVVDGYRYQIFAGFGGATMGDAGVSWVANEEVVLCTINVINGPGPFELVNDAWTEAHNGLYYISLNGLDRTGEVYGSSGLSVNGMEAGTLAISPNPSNGIFEVRLPGAFQATAFTVTDALGRTVRQGNTAGMEHGAVLRVDLRGEAPGAYMLTLAGEYQTLTSRLILAEG